MEKKTLFIHFSHRKNYYYYFMNLVWLRRRSWKSAVSDCLWEWVAVIKDVQWHELDMVEILELNMFQLKNIGLQIENVYNCCLCKFNFKLFNPKRSLSSKLTLSVQNFPKAKPFFRTIPSIPSSTKTIIPKKSVTKSLMSLTNKLYANKQ